jgi:hypothetical protein
MSCEQKETLGKENSYRAFVRDDGLFRHGCQVAAAALLLLLLMPNS